jgi:hypothetical protein
MEKTLGRHLRHEEVVDHIDGLRLHNAPENLRVFPSNAHHLQTTLTGVKKQWSVAGMDRIRKRNLPNANPVPVNKYRQAVKSGDFALRQILLLALRLGRDSPYLLGTTQWTEKAGIDMSDRSKIELALAALSVQWGLAQTQ